MIPLRIPDADSNDEILKNPVSLAIPSLRGVLAVERASEHICRGVWAMSDAAHDIPGQTSEFEFRLVGGTASENIKFPASGKYTGWFLLQQPPPKGVVKVDDKEINIRFIVADDGSSSYKIEGEGFNKFGKFTVYGTLSQEGNLQMYRSYNLKMTPASSTKAKSTKSGVKRHFPVSAGQVDETQAGAVGSIVPSKIKSSKNIQPSSSILSLKELPSRGKKIASASDNSLVLETSPVAISKPMTAPRVSTDGRAHRLSQHMLKCSEMLKDLSRQAQAVWFNEPVDYVKLNIPDYPTVVKEPMDFKTIRTNLEKGLYETPEAFADHVRLTFRNAIAYNTMRDNPVHIAAREMSNRFEEKYRIMLSQLGAGTLSSENDNSSVKSKDTSHGNAKRARKSSVGGGKRSSLGPRPLETLPPPPAMDNNMYTILQMQRKMQEMQNEILQLRTAVQHTEVKQAIESKRCVRIPRDRTHLFSILQSN